MKVTQKQIKGKIVEFWKGTGYKVSVHFDDVEKVALTTLDKGKEKYVYSVSYADKVLLMDSFKHDGYKTHYYTKPQETFYLN